MLIINKRLFSRSLIIAFAAMFLLSCGVKGDLYLPEEEKSAKQDVDKKKLNEKMVQMVNKGVD
ncbi:MAG: lipoprotein [Legionellales bacterium]|nr:lipoprotein [Legionellales bacterium]